MGMTVREFSYLLEEHDRIKKFRTIVVL